MFVIHPHFDLEVLLFVKNDEASGFTENIVNALQLLPLGEL